MDDTTEIIDTILKEKLDAQHVGIIDESHLHRGHKAAGGGGHFSLSRHIGDHLKPDWKIQDGRSAGDYFSWFFNSWLRASIEQF